MKRAFDSGFVRPMQLESLESRRMLSSNLVADYGGIYPTDAIMLDGISYFTADDGVHGKELWRSDGTAAGTRMVNDVTSGAASSSIQGLSVVGDRIVFILRQNDASTSVWRTDGTEDGTILLKQVGLPAPDPWYVPTVVNDRMVFIVEEPRGPITGEELWDWQLWSTDGTVEGTGAIQEIWGADGRYYSYVRDMVSLGERAVYIGSDYRFWSTDGTADGTFVILGGNAGNMNAAWDVDPIDGQFIFALDGKLWRTDGTVDRTEQYSNLPGGQFASFDGRLLYESFHNNSDTGEQERYLAITDGTAGGTQLLASAGEGMWRTSDGASLGSEFLLPVHITTWEDGDPYPVTNQLWKTDGTVAGTQMVLQLAVGDHASFLRSFVTVQNLTFFITTENNVATLWQTDGTSPGTKIVQLLPADTQRLEEIDGRLAVLAGPPFNESVVLVFDPSTMVAPVGPAQGSISLKDGVMRIHGTQGDDSIRIYHHTSAADRFVVNLNGVKKSFLMSAVNKIHIYGYSGDDNISFYDGYGRVATRSRIWGGAGNDIVYTGLNRDTLYGDAGADTLNGGHNDDMLLGGDGDDLVNGGIGNDTANGENGSDHVNGGTGSDVVTGGTDGSQDWVDGGVGADVIFGSSVFDIFFNPGQAGDPLDEILS